jgi:hypothetical protein
MRCCCLAGLLYEDIMIETTDVKLALSRLPKDVLMAREQRLKRTHERLTPFAEGKPDPSVLFQNRRRDDEADGARAPRRQNTAGHATKKHPRHQDVGVQHDLHLARRTFVFARGTSADL